MFRAQTQRRLERSKLKHIQIVIAIFSCPIAEHEDGEIVQQSRWRGGLLGISWLQRNFRIWLKRCGCWIDWTMRKFYTRCCGHLTYYGSNPAPIANVKGFECCAQKRQIALTQWISKSLNKVKARRHYRHFQFVRDFLTESCLLLVLSWKEVGDDLQKLIALSFMFYLIGLIRLTKILGGRYERNSREGERECIELLGRNFAMGFVRKLCYMLFFEEVKDLK